MSMETIQKGVRHDNSGEKAPAHHAHEGRLSMQTKAGVATTSTPDTSESKQKGEPMTQEQALEQLRDLLPPGSKVYTSLNHVSRSGMTRDISLWVIEKDRIRSINYAAQIVMGLKEGKNGGIRVSGCGMDMGFHLVYTLSCYLYPDGFTCAGKKCVSNDHTNGDRNYRRHKHNAGGYALHHEWTP